MNEAILRIPRTLGEQSRGSRAFLACGILRDRLGYCAELGALNGRRPVGMVSRSRT